MLGDFSYSNPTKLYFGEHALEGLRKELPAYGKNVLLVYGGGSIRKTGSTTVSSRSSKPAAKRSLRMAA